MFNRIIRWSLDNRATVLLASIFISAVGLYSLSTMKVDVLPDINKPTVSVFAEGEGLAPEEVERLILTPLEAAVAGTPGVERVRGTASFGLAIVNAEFSFGSDTLRNRQVIQERILRVDLPEGVAPVLGPVASVMGEIMWVSLTAEPGVADGMRLRTLADWTIRPALLRVNGVSDVIVLGGDVKEWQLEVNAEQMRQRGLHLEDITENIGPALNNKSGGLLVQRGKEYPVRILVAPSEIGDLQDIAVGSVNDVPIRLADVATLKEGPSPVRGSATIDGRPGVILRVAKQPEAETLKVTERVDEALESLQASLPRGVDLESDLFRQEEFIHAGLENVIAALRDGTILVVIILILFLMNARVTLITLTAIPLSILVTIIVFRGFGLSVNVMTLGGVAVAIGELVDDAIVDVENVFRRLREWRHRGAKEPILDVVFTASSEVRNSIVYATVLVAVVFLPIFFIPGVEGRLLSALGAAYLISLVASLVVSLTVTPVLASLLLKRGPTGSHDEETRFVRFIKRHMAPVILWSIHHARTMMVGTAATLVVAASCTPRPGRKGSRRSTKGPPRFRWCCQSVPISIPRMCLPRGWRTPCAASKACVASATSPVGLVPTPMTAVPTAARFRWHSTPVLKTRPSDCSRRSRRSSTSSGARITPSASRSPTVSRNSSQAYALQLSSRSSETILPRCASPRIGFALSWRSNPGCRTLRSSAR